MAHNEKENFDSSLTVRINADDLRRFKSKSVDLGKPYQLMIREMIRAFVDGRVCITPTNEQKESLKIYQPFKKD